MAVELIFLSITKQTDNNSDDSNSSLTVSQILEDPASRERELSLSLGGDDENIHSYVQTEWFKDGTSLNVSTGLSSLTVDSSIDGTYYSVVDYFDGELNKFSVSSDSVLFDSTAPTLSSSTPADNATAVATDSNIVLNFSEEVDVESGNIVIYKSSDDSEVETFNVASSGLISGSGSTQITINPSSDLEEQLNIMCR